MKTRWMLVAAAVAVAASPAWAHGAWSVKGKVWLEGDSTLHKYSAEAKNVAIRLDAAPADTADAQALVRAGAIKGLLVSIPVAHLTSGKGDLDKNMRKALEVAKHRNITFRMSGYQVAPSPPGADLALKVEGTLAIAGVQRPVEMDVTAKSVSGGLRLTGAKALKMTDFGIQPPVFMLGTLKTHDDVTVRFDLHLVAPPPSPPGS